MPQRKNRQNPTPHARRSNRAPSPASSRGGSRAGRGDAAASRQRATGRSGAHGVAGSRSGGVHKRGGAASSRASLGSNKRGGAAASRQPVHSASSVTPRTADDQGFEATLPGAGEVLITRRHFLYGLASVATLAALGGGGYAISQVAGSDSGNVTTLKVPESAVFSSDDCTQIEDASSVAALVSSQELAYGTLIWANSDTTAACLIPAETAKPLAQVGLLSLTSGTCTTVIEHAVGEDEGFEIYDVRSCDDGLIWAEADILEGIWRVYHATLDGMVVGTPVLAEEGTSEWEMPMLATAGGYAFWQKLPNPEGSAQLENSTLTRAAFGSSSSEVVYSSSGRFSCAPCSTRDAVICAPRADVSGTYYQLTRIEASSGQVADALVLPASMKPYELGFSDAGFSFAFDGIYNYGDGIANLGTYTPAEAVTTGILGNGTAAESEASSAGATEALTLAERNAAAAASIAQFDAIPYGDASWFRFARTPLTSPAWCGKWMIVKSTSAVCGVDLSAREYFALDAENGADDYGEFLASTGSGKRVVTYSNIDHTDLTGESTKHCLVKVWEMSE